MAQNFVKLGLRKAIGRAFESLGFHSPTNIQLAAIPRLVKQPKTNFLVTAQTGTGKTLAYLAPVVEAIKRSEEKDGGSGKISLRARPRALILVPTRELGEQILGVAKMMSYEARFRSVSVLGNVAEKTMNMKLQGAIDLLVATPGTLDEYQKTKKNVFLSYVTHLVLDEADVLMTGKGFPEVVTPFLKYFKERDVQFIYVAATVPPKLEGRLKVEHQGNLEVIRAGNVHHMLSKKMYAEFVRVTSQPAKIAELRKAIETEKKMIIFCNTTRSCQFVGKTIDELGYACSTLYGGQPRSERSENWRTFKEGWVNLLVCTDIGSRGLDDEDVEMVFMFEVPRTSEDYLHRAGRLRQEGRILVLVEKRSLNFARTLFLSHVNHRSMQELETLEYSQTQKSLNHVRRRRGQFRDAVEPNRDDHERDRRIRKWRRTREHEKVRMNQLQKLPDRNKGDSSSEDSAAETPKPKAPKYLRRDRSAATRPV